MMCAISAAESDSADSGIDDRNLNDLGGAIVYQSEGSAVVIFFIMQKRVSINFPSSIS